MKIHLLAVAILSFGTFNSWAGGPEETYGGSLLIQEKNQWLFSTCATVTDGRCTEYNLVTSPANIPDSIRPRRRKLNPAPINERNLGDIFSHLNLKHKTIESKTFILFDRAQVGSVHSVNLIDAQKIMSLFIYGKRAIDLIGEWKETGFSLEQKWRIKFELDENYQITLKHTLGREIWAHFPIKYEEKSSGTVEIQQVDATYDTKFKLEGDQIFGYDSYYEEYENDHTTYKKIDFEY